MHVTCNQSWIKLNSNMPSFSAYILSSIMSIFATTKKGGGVILTFIILHIMNQVYSACVIQCTIQIFHHYYKSEIYKCNLDLNDILVIKHTLYICFICPLPLRMIILFYGEYIVHLRCQWKRRLIHTKIVCIYMFHASISIWHCIFSVSFGSVFRSAF